MAISANLNLPIGPDLKWGDLVKFVEMGDALGMQPDDGIHLDYSEDHGDSKLEGLTIFVDPSLIEYRTP